MESSAQLREHKTGDKCPEVQNTDFRPQDVVSEDQNQTLQTHDLASAVTQRERNPTWKRTR